MEESDEELRFSKRKLHSSGAISSSEEDTCICNNPKSVSRSSERLQKKRQRLFNKPTRAEVNNRYNYDPLETSGEESLDDFIVDDVEDFKSESSSDGGDSSSVTTRIKSHKTQPSTPRIIGRRKRLITETDSDDSEEEKESTESTEGNKSLNKLNEEKVNEGYEAAKVDPDEQQLHSEGGERLNFENVTGNELTPDLTTVNDDDDDDSDEEIISPQKIHSKLNVLESESDATDNEADDLWQVTKEGASQAFDISSDHTANTSSSPEISNDNSSSEQETESESSEEEEGQSGRVRIQKLKKKRERDRLFEQFRKERDRKIAKETKTDSK
ncbi:hypothetical protein MAR_024578 [Mya arenaria]|uniref:Uncharacterized protein n=1 Tax=Mya arenaria TaxID=6604 RepID=A0ABY7DZ67_MYAAR|nr:hypothetical protein MAR_024578 [Mya arenaria]